MAIKARFNDDNSELTVTLPVEPKESSTGKTLVIASTRGNIRTGLEYQDKEVHLGVNAYTFKSARQG